MDANHASTSDPIEEQDTCGSTDSSPTTESTAVIFQSNQDDEDKCETEEECEVHSEPQPPPPHCCVRNLDVCCGDNVRGVRDCGVCLGRAAKDVYGCCRRLDCREGAKKTFTVNNVRRKFPVSLWLPKYRLKYLLGDVIAGLTVGLTALPQGLAYAKIALLPPQYGLYSLFMPCYAYLVFGTAKDVSIGPTAVMSLLTSEFAASPIEGDPTYAIVLAMMCGIIQFAMGVLNLDINRWYLKSISKRPGHSRNQRVRNGEAELWRICQFKLGFLVDYISHPVINAFTMASVVTITSSQIPNWLGLEGIPREFVQQVYEIFNHISETKLYDFLLGLVCMIFLFLMKKMKSFTCMVSKSDSRCIAAGRYSVWLLSTARNAIVVMGAAGLAAILEMYGHVPFSLTGTIPPGLPPFKPPSFSVSDGNTTYNAEDIFKTIGSGFLVVPLLGIVETVAIGKSFARMNNYKVDPNQELLASGMGNLLGSFVSAYPVTGSFSRTSVNCQSGARTTGAGFWTGTLVLIVIAFLTPIFYYIPDATLAAIIIMAVLDMADFTLLIELWRVKKIDLVPWFVTFVCALLISVDKGLLIGVLASLAILLYPSARPKITTVSDDCSYAEISDLKKTDEQTSIGTDHVVLELNQGLTFPAAEHFMKHVLKEMVAGESSLFRSVILDFSRVTTTDSTITRSIEHLAEDFKVAGVKLVLCNVQRQVMKILVKANIKHVIYATTKAEAMKIIKDSTGEEEKDVTIFVLSLPTESVHEDLEKRPYHSSLEFNIQTKEDGCDSLSVDSHQDFNTGYEMEYYEF